MKRILLALLFLSVPALALAATTDFTANSDLTVSSVTFDSSTADMLILNGSTAESWTFSSGAFTVTNPGTFKVGSSDSSVKSIQFLSGSTALACSENTTPGTSFATAPTASGTYTVTPSATTQCTSLCTALSNVATYNSFPTCGAASCNAGFRLSGSGAGATCVALGGGVALPSGYTPTNLPAPRPQIVYPDGTVVYLDEGGTALPGAGTPVSALFTKTLGRGSEGGDVERLQRLLASDSSLYPEGLVTGYFGALTEAAVQKFQAKYGIASSGTPDSTGYGVVGPKTRAKLQEIFGTSGVLLPQTPSIPVSQELPTTFSRTLGLGMEGDDVRQLQILLNRDPDTLVAEAGVGSPGNETKYFGSLTQSAVQKFQAKYGIVSSGTPDSTGYGVVGPKTREKLKALP